MTPKPINLPPVDQMTPAQIIAEAARILRNAGGPDDTTGGDGQRSSKLAVVAEIYAYQKKRPRVSEAS